MTVCFEQRPEFFDFFNQHSGTSHRPGNTCVIASLVNGAISAVVLYSRMTRGSCELSITTDRNKNWASRSFIRAVFDYPFAQLGYKRCGVMVNTANTDSLALAEQLGFVHEGVLRAYFDGDDACALSMLRTECRWID